MVRAAAGNGTVRDSTTSLIGSPQEVIKPQPGNTLPRCVLTPMTAWTPLMITADSRQLTIRKARSVLALR